MIETTAPLYHTLRFVPMRLDHLAAVAAIEQVSFPTPRSRALYRNELEKNRLGHYFVIEPAIQGQRALPTVLAYGGYWLTGDEGHVVVIATEPQWRRNHLGQWLLLEMLTAARLQGALKMTLEVRQHNAAAFALYVGLGFTEVGIHKRYYRDTDEDAHLLTLFELNEGAIWRSLAKRLEAFRQLFLVRNDD